MNTYEASLIFKPILDLDTTEGGILRHLEDLIQNLNGKVNRIEKVGRKRLAYEIKKFKDGYITNMLIELEPSAIAPFRKSCQMNEDILRLTLLKMDEDAVTTSATTNTTVASQNAPQMREGRMGGPGGPGGPGGRRPFGPGQEGGGGAPHHRQSQQGDESSAAVASANS